MSVDTVKIAAETLPVTKVVVHPLVLLSVVDHYTRMHKIGSKKRVVGVLLGSWRSKGVLDVSNSYAGKIYYIIFCSFHFICFRKKYSCFCSHIELQ